MMYNVKKKDLVIGREYVFGRHSGALGFVPTTCFKGRCRLTVEGVSRDYVRVVEMKGNFDREGFFEVETAKKLYRRSLKDRQSRGYAQSDEVIEELVANL